MRRSFVASLFLALAFAGPPHAEAGEVGPPAPTAGDEAGDVTPTPGTLHNRWDDPANGRVDVGPVGSTGLLSVSSAELGPVHLLRFSAYGDYSHTLDFPVQGATNTRSAGTFSVSYVPVPFLQAFLAYGLSANTNTTSSPPLLEALGNVTFGAKAATELVPGLSLGLDLRGESFPSAGGQQAGQYSFGFVPLAVVTYNRTGLDVPLRIHGNAGFLFDRTERLSGAGLDAADEFALGLHRYNRATASLGLELPLPYATPFGEYRLEVPLGVPGGVLQSPDGSTEPIARALPQTLDVGVKLTAFPDVTVTLAGAFAVVRYVGLGVPAVPPWSLSLGVSYAVDPTATRQAACVEAAPEPSTTTGRVVGVVMDAETQRPLGDAILTFEGTGLPPVASDSLEGRYATQELSPGPTVVHVTREGYRERNEHVIVRRGRASELMVSLEPLARSARISLTVTAAGKPVVASVLFRGASERQLSLQPGAASPVWLDVPAGRYSVEVTAPAHLSQVRDVQVTAGADMALVFELLPEPKKKLVVVKNDKIEILQQVHFANGQAVIQPDSAALLAQVVDAIVRNNIKRVRIEGHTDNRGNPGANLRLSQARAQAVATYLEQAGIDPERLEAKGYGDTRPIAPNLTQRGRQLNRRVEFVILER